MSNSSSEKSLERSSTTEAAPPSLNTSHGRTTIADTVVAKIAGIAAREVSGVHQLGGSGARAVGALRERIPGLAEKGIGFTVVSGDMIEGTITATLLERANPGAIADRRESAGKLYNVSEFAAEVARAAVDPVPADNTRLVGDTSDFVAE